MLGSTVDPIAVLRLDNAEGLTPLHRASLEGHLNEVNLLLSHGADVKANFEIDKVNGLNALHLAALGGHHKLLSALLAAGADANTVTVKAPSEADPEMDYYIKALWSIQQLAKETTYEWSVCWQGLSPLHYAVIGGNLNVIDALLEKGVEVNAFDEYGFTALHFASLFQNRLNVVELLLKRGANPKQCDTRGSQALHMAARNNCLDAAKLLLHYGAEVNKLNLTGLSPLQYALDVHHKETLQKRSDMPYPGRARLGVTILAYPAPGLEFKAELVETLLEHRADESIVDDEGNTALHLAALHGLVKIALILLYAGLDPNAINHEGLTPLYCARVYNRDAMRSALLTHGADPFFKVKAKNLFETPIFRLSTPRYTPPSFEEKRQMLDDYAWSRRKAFVMLRAYKRAQADSYYAEQEIVGSGEAAGGAGSSEGLGAKL
ncbi:MAG: ankyrin repeat protein [Gammaproteobacteria bacterium]|jgi:ankyrin repeat protein|nr:ankyrin repeat protein [Gammaproteobacteria bacterium]